MTTALRIGMFAVIAGVFAIPAPSFAQRPYSPYRPARPTLSPYFGLFERNTGPLPNYHTYVRPRQEEQRMFGLQQAEIDRQRASLNSLNQEIEAIRQTQPESAPTGTKATFMDYSHYYQIRGSKPSGGRTWSPPASRGGGTSMGF